MRPDTESHPHEAAAVEAAARAPSGNRFAQAVYVGFFLALIASAGLIQTVVELRRGDPLGALRIFGQKPTSANLRAYEDRLEEESIVARALRPWVTTAQFQWLKDGGEKTLVGRDGWLFYKPGFDERLRLHPAQPGSLKTNDPLTAIVAYRDSLAARGIRLVLMPAPNKESVYPDKATRRWRASPEPSPQMGALLRDLRARKVEVLDLFELFASARKASEATNGPTLYLRTDTHWSPEGLECAAIAMANYLRETGPAALSEGSSAHSMEEARVEVPRAGDLVKMLQAPALERSVPSERVWCLQTRFAPNAAPHAPIPVLVLGDSFLRIYEQDAPTRAGFVSRLARALGHPVDSVINDGGASTLVRQELHRKPGLLSSKKVVIWEFVERDLSLGTEGWPVVPLPPAL